MTGPNGVRDRSGTSGKAEGPDRRRRGAATSSQTNTKGAIRAVRTYVLNRKYTLIYLLLLILLAFAVRSVWYYDAAYTGGPTPLLSGNDPDYHKRTVDYFVENHHFLKRDTLLNYPGGGPNPNPPAYSTSIALLGHAMKPFFGGDLEASVWFSMEIGAALWAALTVIPVYLFTKEMFGRRSAYLAAFFIAIMAGNIERTPLGFSDHDAFFMFFIVTGFFFLLKALRNVKTKKYVEDWRQPRDITIGLTDFFRSNRIGLLYASMAGIALTAVALSWKGFPYALAIIFVYLLFHLLVNKFRRIDNTAVGLTILFTVSMFMLLSLPYYITMNFMNWYEAPAILYAAICLVVAVFLFTRDLPWLLIIPILLLIIVVALTAVWVLLPDVWVNIFSGAGYFIRTKLYGTIAEAQPPDINRLVFSYGMTTFFLAMYGVFIMIKNLPKGWKNDHIFTTIWALVSVYMAVAAIRFMYNATPVMAILAGWITYDLMERLDYRRMIRVFRSMKGDFIKALKYSVKVRHVAGVLFVVFLIVFPNTWHGVDAGIPYENKKAADLKIYNALPDFMRPSNELYDPDSNSLWYLGSFGTSFMSDYWAQGMWWLSQQDTWQDEDDRPAFISWWDYGHWCVQVGKHPTAADNFQNGVEFAGNFIAAQGEEEASALMVVRLFQLNKKDDRVIEYMEKQLGETLTDELLDLFDNPTKYTPLIAKYPERYGLKDKEVNWRNTIFIHGTWLVNREKDMDELTNMLLWFRNELGDEYRYFAVDSRLMPTSYRNTGIFYAPITLSDNRVDEYIEIVAIHNGNQITLDQAATLPIEERQNLQYQLVWKRPFFESMFYRAFIGYSGYDQGPDFKDTGIPFVTGDLARNTPLPGWNMSHWRVAHRTIHYNPYNETEVQDHPLDWDAISYDEAVRLKDSGDDGIFDDAIRSISSGVIYLKYYAGAWVNGTVTTESGEPVPGATVTVHDDFRFFGGYMGPDFVGIPHGTTQTDENGRYSILAPYGNVTVVASNGGGLDYFMLHETNILNQSNIYISDDAAMRQGDYNFTLDFLVPTSRQTGYLYGEVSDNGTFDENEDVAFDNATITIKGQQGLNRTYVLTTYPDGYFELDDALPGNYKVSMVWKGHEVENAGFMFLTPNSTQVEDLIIRYSKVLGQVTRRDAKDAEGTEVTIRDLQTNETKVVEADGNGDYEFADLLPGNYSVEVFEEGLRPVNESVTLSAQDEFELNITLLPTAFLEGMAFHDIDSDGQMDPGEGLTNATITFHRLYQDDLVWTTTTNGTGHYNTSLPTGIYSTYIHEIIDDDHLANLTLIEVDADEWVYPTDFALRDAYLVKGSLKRPTSDTNDTLMEAGRTKIQLWSDNGRLEVTANVNGSFSMYLPQDTYSFFTWKDLLGRPRVILDNFSVIDSQNDLGELVLVNGTRIEGHVYFDKNGNLAVNSAESQADVEVIFDANGHVFNLTTAANGSFMMVSALLNYTVTIDTPAFEPFNSSMDATNPNLTVNKKNFALTPYNVTYTGIAGYDWNDDGNLSDDGYPHLLVTFEADNPSNNPNAVTTNTTTDADGKYEVQLAPGKYKVKVQLDRDEDLGTFRFKHDRALDVNPSTENGTYNVWLERLVRVNGTISTNDNITDLSVNVDIGSTEYRLNARNGEFEGHVPVGEHLLTATHYEAVANSTDLIRYELETIIDIDRPLELNLTMYQVVLFKGFLYYDWNDNGQYDPYDPDDPDSKEEGKHMPSFVLQGLNDHDVYPATNGSFDTKVFPYDNYTMYLQRREHDVEAGIEFQWVLNDTIDLTSDTVINIPLSRRLEVSGRAFWDLNEDNASSINEGIEGVEVTYEAVDGSSLRDGVTNDQGVYRIFVPVDTEGKGSYHVRVSHPGFEPNRTHWEFDVDPRNFTKDLRLLPLNITLNGTTFMDLNGNGDLNRYETVLPVDHIEIWNSTNVSVHYELQSDGNGTFNVTVPPGTYDVVAWTEVEGAYFVHLSVLDVRPTGTFQDLEVPMTPGRRVSGIMFFVNQTGRNHTVPEANLTFTQLDGKGSVPILPTTGGQFSAVLPNGRYRVNGTYTNEEFGVDMTYEVDEEFRAVLKDKGDLDLNFTKRSEHKLELWWDDMPVFLDENTSYNYTIYVKNVGSENGTFDISVDTPANWLHETEVDNITLNISRMTSFWVVVNISAQASAAKVHIVTVSAIPRNGTDDPSELDLEVNINPHYGFNLKAPEDAVGFYTYDAVTGDHHISYNFIAENRGNTKETLNFTVAPVLNWTIDIGPGEIQLDPYDSKPSIPLEVTVPPKTELNPQILTITARASNNPSTPTQTLELELTFPDLLIEKDDVSGEIEGKPIEWPKDAPGFGTFLAMIALVGTALVARTRRRWS